MNYYEELGIPTTASPDEVRQAYRNLARLLHPDRQSDEALRRLAGIQMVRLNETLRTLTDPHLRTEYDAALRSEAHELTFSTDRMRQEHAETVEMPLPMNQRWSRYAWPGAAVMGVLFIGLFLAQDAAVQHPSAAADLSILAGVPDTPPGAWPAKSDGRYPFSSRTQESTNPFNRTDSRGGAFSGQWYYAKPARLADPDGICPPLYIDMDVSQEGKSLRGRYSARYAVGERQISPIVVFEFSGWVQESTADLPWNGDGGASGRVRLTLVSARSMRVEWNVDRIGDRLGLTSGSATLVRQASQ